MSLRDCGNLRDVLVSKVVRTRATSHPCERGVSPLNFAQHITATTVAAVVCAIASD